MKLLIILIIISVSLLTLIVSRVFLASRSKNDQNSFYPTGTFITEIPDSQEDNKSFKDNTSQSLTIDDYRINWFIVSDPNKIFLYSNLDEKKPSEDLANQYNCRYLINAGFYSEDFKHIGLFVSEGKTLSSSQKNSLLNGYFSISGKTALISSTPPPSSRIAIQSGPILFSMNRKLTVSSQSEENARRIVVATQKDGMLVFMIIYSTKNLFLGPKLSELPDIIDKINDDGVLKLQSALNLDGGTHSAFITDEILLTELSSIGGFFCIIP